MAAKKTAEEPKAEGQCEHNPDPQGWGWWTAHERQNDYLRSISAHVPWPNEKIIPGHTEMADYPPMLLKELLERYGGYLTFLRAERGLWEGKVYALHETYDSALTALKGQSLTELPKGATEAAKEAWALNHPDFSETLRQTKRLNIEWQGIVLTIKGLIDAYQGAWETVSRLVTAAGIEADLASNRVP